MARLVVIMAVRNSESTVRQAVSSTLRALRGKDAEMHVMDDCSTDSTAEVLAGIEDKKLKVHRSSDRLGSGMARNALIAATDSELVANMDGDDISLPWRFNASLLRMEGIDALFSSVLKFGGKPPVRPTYPFSFEPEQSRLAVLFHDPFWHPTMLARRAALDAVSGYRPLPRAQDYDLWLRMLANGQRIVRRPIPTVLYRMSPTQVTAEEGFLGQVRSSEDLWNSYSNLFRLVTGSDPVRGSERTAQELAGVAASMRSRVLSSYYSRLVREQKTTLV